MTPKSAQEISTEIASRTRNHMYGDNVQSRGAVALFYLTSGLVKEAIEAERTRAKILEDSLEFYGTTGHYIEQGFEVQVSGMLKRDGGKRAREALLKFRGGE